MKKMAFIAALLLSSGGASLFAASTLQLIGPPSNGITLDNIYISPYTALINGVSTPVICDDFVDEVQLGESWSATVSNVGALASNVKWATDPGVAGYNEQASYNEAAWLATQLLSPTTTSVQAGEISYAIWAVFDPIDVKSWLSADLATTSAVFGKTGYLAQASAFSTTNFSNVLVYTPVAGSQSCCGVPQEFLALTPPTVGTPEASGVATLGVDFLGLMALVAVFRRRIFAASN